MIADVQELAWQPMESAPKDGRTIVVCGLGNEIPQHRHEQERPLAATAHWVSINTDRFEQVEGGMYRKIEGPDEGYWSLHGLVSFIPTRWMSLPDTFSSE